VDPVAPLLAYSLNSELFGKREQKHMRLDNRMREGDEGKTGSSSSSGGGGRQAGTCGCNIGQIELSIESEASTIDCSKGCITIITHKHTHTTLLATAQEASVV
jgi:hypothetical protein